MPSFVIVTETGREPFVVGKLADSGIAAYCPAERRKHFGYRRITVREGPIFPRYVFVHTDELERDFETIRHRTPHVTAFLSYNGKPKPIPDEWLGAFLVMQSLGGFDYAADRRPQLRLGQIVRLIAGQFQGWSGEITEFRDARVVLSMKRGGRLVVASGDLRAA